jgi:hypothetical protein
MFQKKLLTKTWRKNALFSLLLMFVKLVLLITFFGAFFHNLFNGFEISVKFCVFLHLFGFFSKNFFLKAILVFFSNFEAKRAKNGSKNQKTYLVNVSYISILHPSKGLYSLFSKSKSNSLYPTVHCTGGKWKDDMFCIPIDSLLEEQYVYSSGQQSVGARNWVGAELSYRPARLHRLTESIPWNRFLKPLKVNKYRLSRMSTADGRKGEGRGEERALDWDSPSECN